MVILLIVDILNGSIKFSGDLQQLLHDTFNSIKVLLQNLLRA